MKKLMLVFGTRPEAIKMCPLVKEFQKRKEEFETIVCATSENQIVLRARENTWSQTLNMVGILLMH